MRLAVLGRSRRLLDTAALLLASSHAIALVGTSPAEPHHGAGVDDFARLAASCNADFFCDHRINDPAIVERLQRAGCELAVSNNWKTILRAPAIAAFSGGVLNAHAGDLPGYRGNAAPNWAILNGEPHVGLCVHEMLPDVVDAGPILARDLMPISRDTYIGDVIAWLNKRMPTLYAEAVDGLAAGVIRPRPQPEDPAAWLRCYPRRPGDSRIDWGQPAEMAHRLVRASSRPFAGAFTTLEGQARLGIWRATIFDHPGRFAAMPGQVLFGVEGDPVIACGAGALRLDEIELDVVPDSAAAKKLILKSLRNRLV